MKKVLICVSLLSMIFGFTAFECSSAELTGAKLYITQKQYSKAKEALQKEVQKNPASDEGWYLLGFLLGDENNYSEMLDAFDKSLAISKKFEAPIKDYKKYAWQTSFNKGVAFFNSAVKTTKEDSVKLFFEKAIEMFKFSTLCEPDSSVGYENTAIAYINMNNSEAAVPLLENMITKFGKPEWIFSRLGQIYMMKGSGLMDNYKVSKNKADSSQASDWYSKAITVLEKGRVKFPADPDILLQLGNAYYAANKIDVAEASFKTLVEKNPTNKEMKYAYGVVLLKAEKYEMAAAQLEELILADPENTDAYYNLAAAYINWGNDMRDEAIKKETNDKSFQAKFKLAVPLLEKYLTKRPSDARVWVSLGQVYANLGEVEKSKAAFKKADENK